MLSGSLPYLFWIALIPLVTFSAFIWDGIYVGATASAADAELDGHHYRCHFSPGILSTARPAWQQRLVACNDGVYAFAGGISFIVVGETYFS